MNILKMENNGLGVKMRYVFKAKTTRIIRIEANNMEEAKQEYLDNYMIMSREKNK